MSGYDKATTRFFRRLAIPAGFGSADWLAEINRQGCRAGERAAELLDGFDPNGFAASVNLARVSVAELGFDDCRPIQAIYLCARAQGLRLCPPATGPCLRAQFLDQPSGDWLYVAMTPVRDHDGVPAIFELDCAFDSHWLRGFIAMPSKLFHPRDSFLFSA